MNGWCIGKERKNESSMNWIRIYENVIFEMDCLLHGVDSLRRNIMIGNVSHKHGRRKLQTLSLCH